MNNITLLLLIILVLLIETRK